MSMSSPFTPEALLARVPRCQHCRCLVTLHPVTAGTVKHRGCCEECGRDRCPRYVPEGAEEPAQQPAQPERTARRAHYNPTLQRHSWRRGDMPHWRHCNWCGIHVENRPDPHSPRWFQEWHWDDRPGDNNYGGGSIPKCPGPAEPRQNAA